MAGRKEMSGEESAQLWRFFCWAFLRPAEPTLAESWPEVCGLLGLEGVLPWPDALEVEREFAKLFYGVSGRNVRACASNYASPLGLGFQQAARDVRSEYRKAGFAPADAGMPDDHIAIECAFAAMLAENDPALARGFAKAFLGWVPLFCKELAAHPAADFYGEVARALETFWKSQQP